MKLDMDPEAIRTRLLTLLQVLHLEGPSDYNKGWNAALDEVSSRIEKRER